ncbi:hypothetical protein [Parvibaculum sp.]|uniref:hypothetical protein n=1 Tax=Parvibaculum sp. TaxID=2024848 RepID=UPI003C779333
MDIAMSEFFRKRIEATIEYLLTVLDEMDGDPDFEPEPLEEQNDAEADLTWTSGIAPGWFLVAERARRRNDEPDMPPGPEGRC